MAELKTSLALSFKDYFSKSFNKLSRELGSLNKAQKNQTETTKKSTKANKKNELSFKDLGNAIAGVALVSKTLGALNIAKEFENTKIDLSTVLGEDLNSKELESFFNETKAIAKKGLGSFQDVASTQYNLISAGLDKAIIGSATNTVLEVAKVTKGSADQVASVIATASKNFGEETGRVGDVLAKTQAKFQFANFDQLGQGFANVGASASAMKLPIEQTATALGVLNDAGVTGSNAGTSLNAVLRQLNKASDELGVDIVRTADGSLDLVATLRQIDKATNDLNLDEKSKEFQEIFGDEGKKGLLPLLQQLPKIDKHLKEVSKDSRGFVGQEAQKHYESFGVKVQGLTNSLMILKNAFAKHMLPALIQVIDKVMPLISSLTIFMEQNPAVAKSIFAVSLALGALLASATALKVFAFLVSPLKMFRFAIVALTAPVKMLRIAMIALRFAFLSTPIGWVVAGLTALVTLGTLLYNKFEPVRELFNKLAEPFKKIASFTKKLFGGKSAEIKQTQEQNINTNTALETESLQIPSLATATANTSSSPSNVTYNNTFNVQGASAGEVVELVIKKLNKQNLGAM